MQTETSGLGKETLLDTAWLRRELSNTALAGHLQVETVDVCSCSLGNSVRVVTDEINKSQIRLTYEMEKYLKIKIHGIFMCVYIRAVCVV